jgi:protein-ribulosamine 3-kinase
MIPQEIKDSLGTFLSHQFAENIRIYNESALSGGCINQVYRFTTQRGVFCLKYNRTDAFPGMFEAESRGLKRLKEAAELPVPSVIHQSTLTHFSYLLLEYLEPGIPLHSMMYDFGRALARLHKHRATYFGEEQDNYMGALPQSNRKHDNWISFFVEERLERQVSLAREKGQIDKEDASLFQRLFKQLENLLPVELPSLVHGDLWGGNYLVMKDGTACLIDPAVYYGHREIDLAMSRLFGGFDSSFYRGYQEEYPLEKGWEERMDIYNLYPLLVHLNLFGSGYLEQILSIVRRF